MDRSRQSVPLAPIGAYLSTSGEPVHDHRVPRTGSVIARAAVHRGIGRRPRPVPQCGRGRIPDEQDVHDRNYHHFLMRTSLSKGRKAMKNTWFSRVAVGTACLGLGLAVTYACTDFLNTPAQATLDENALATKVGVEGALIAAYRSLDCNNATNGNWGCAASNWPFGSITSDDAYKGSEATDQPQATKLELYVWSSDQAQDYLDRKWASMYEGVVRANATIRLLQKVSLKAGQISHADSMGIMGEALFLRAHYHFEAWRMWGNIPYYYETDTDFRKANLSADSAAKLVIADLNAAAALLPTTPRNGQVGRATSWGARAYKGRVLLYTHQYAAAVATLDSVVASGQYALETSFDHVWTGFHAFENGKETILAYEASVNAGEPNGNN